jgi:tetratricopeptide (TPR) repeat protein
MRVSSHAIAVLALVSGLLLSGCAASGPSGASRAELQARVALNPNDSEALRDLGVLYAAEQNYPRAAESLQRAFDRRADDPRTLYYLGLVNEVLGKQPTALRLYEQYESVPAASPYRERLRGRYQWLLRRQVRAELREAMAQEGGLAPIAGDNAVGVIPFAFRGGASRFEPLGRGLAEFISADLANVEGLTVVERVRLGVLLGEIELAQSGAIDAATAPRYGRLLRANRLVGGQYGVTRNNLSMDAGVFSADDVDALPTLENTAGAVDRLFDLQKEVVAKLLVELGIEPTPEQLARVSRAPTRDLGAFVAFSRGLQLEDREQYARAADLYQEAVKADPNFSEAARKAAECRAIASQLGAPEDLLAMVEERNALLGRRSGRLNGALGSSFIPGIDNRDPAGEGQHTGTLCDLPDPPAPPSGGGN